MLRYFCYGTAKKVKIRVYGGKNRSDLGGGGGDPENLNAVLRTRIRIK